MHLDHEVRMPFLFPIIPQIHYSKVYLKLV
nr:MAG TPA: hypothetical protein [Bacteriophage sp.]